MTTDERLHFKHTTLGFAYATYDDLCKGQLILRSHIGDSTHEFVDVSNLLLAGWVID